MGEGIVLCLGLESLQRYIDGSDLVTRDHLPIAPVHKVNQVLGACGIFGVGMQHLAAVPLPVPAELGQAQVTPLQCRPAGGGEGGRGQLVGEPGHPRVAGCLGPEVTAVHHLGDGDVPDLPGAGPAVRLLARRRRLCLGVILLPHLQASILGLLLKSLQLGATWLFGGTEAAVKLGQPRRQQRCGHVHGLAARLHAHPPQEGARPVYSLDLHLHVPLHGQLPHEEIGLLPIRLLRYRLSITAHRLTALRSAHAAGAE
mmetsp:Transcript_10138/g.30389  ORF Transcript_10138/g.30389 Transcript_10138/m.30389 type:complete len:257 (+) Transcript_10138:1035-1805(+)